MVGHLSYVGHAAVTKRLLDSDPTWSWEPLSLDANGEPHFDESGGLWIKLTVASHTRLGYGHSEQMKYSEIGSRTKAVISDALRNAAMRFGVALEEWHKGDLGLPDPLILDGSGFGGDGVESPTGKPAVRMPEAAPQPAVVGAGSELPNPAPVCPEEPKAQTAAAASEPMAEEGEVNFITKKLAALKETDADKLILDTIGTGTLDNLTKNNFAKLKLAVKGKK